MLKKIFKNKLKIHFFNKLLFFSTKGNFAMISAIMIPLLAFLLGIALVTSNYLLHKSSVESASEEALNHGMSLICSQDDITRDDVKKIILKDLIVSLKKNNFTKQEADLVAKNSKIDITTLISDSKNAKSYHFYIKSVYKMPLNEITKIFYPKDLTIVTHVNKIAPCHYKSYVMLPNPQSNIVKSDWNFIHRRTVNAINSIIEDKNIAYMIINGSMTSYDHSYYSAEIRQFNNVYAYLNLLIFRSIGVRDYVDNNYECSDKEILSDGSYSIHSCSFAALNDLSWRIINDYSAILPEINYDVQKWKEGIFIHTHHIKGSLAYTWNDNNIHFVQLNDSLFYMDHYRSVIGSIDCQIESMITPNGVTSLWFQRDLEKARKENKAIILFIDNIDKCCSTPAQRHEFENLVARYKIAAIFGKETDRRAEFFYGHNHVTKFYNTKTTLHNSGDFILLENKGHSLDVSFYNTSTGRATLAKKMSSITLPH
ncbi:hypothetical protein AP064_01410 [Candidatus Liberibacter solanacearum]|uniref:Uncharacterized protein n=2 Tax=Candidatus Liberibacter solanacearum TaxID=556287 RepID=A0A0F4VJ42_9HYPH|nr:hypothetical protein KP07_02650 [Candidatus Liberibacter solanacearum]KJZ81880.1 hypothetical protein DJ66_0608 [Candidatus Liberibacter solanacearum]KQC49664.1 hypothetical protein AP064_01410 [Candidatus Liberibacter solanacearum]